MIKYFNFFLLFLVFLPSIALTDGYPKSIEKWRLQSDYFWKMDFSNESAFKTKLKNYYTNVFTGDLKDRFYSWIDEGSLKSDHFSWFYKKAENTKAKNIIKDSASNNYIFNETQTKCFAGDYNAPDMKTIVSKYKVINKTQSEVDKHIKSLKLPIDFDACLIIDQRTTIYLTSDKEPLIYKIQQEIIESKLNFE